MCDHANDAEAHQCMCTGYGMGDLPCRCGRGKSLHENGIGRCTIPAARCHEFVPALVEPFNVTEDHITAATAAIIRELGDLGEAASRAALAALTAGRESTYVRDRELDRVRREHVRLRDEVAALTAAAKETQDARTAGPALRVGGDHNLGRAGAVDPGRVQPPDAGAGDLRLARRAARRVAVRRLRRPTPVVFPAGSTQPLRGPVLGRRGPRRDPSERLQRRIDDLMKQWYYGAAISTILVVGLITIAFKNGT